MHDGDDGGDAERGPLETEPQVEDDREVAERNRDQRVPLRIAGDGGFLSVLGAVLVGVPLYSDAVGIIPIAEVLLGKGVPLGTVLAFMMAVTALSLPEMVILRKVVRWPLLGVYAGYLASAFVVVGMLFNQLGVMR